MNLTNYFFSLIAGSLSLLAPCVLPILPLLIANSFKTSKYGPIASALGLTFSFTLFGILTSVFSNTFDPMIINKIGGIILILVGLVILIPKCKNIFNSATNFFTSKGNNLQNKILNKNSLISEFFAGSLLGLVWSPCTGPTLGIAIGLASQSKNLMHASLIYIFFGLGAGIGMISLGYLVRKIPKSQSILLKVGKKLNNIIAILSIIIGILIVSNLLATIEEIILKLLPDFIINLSTML